MYIFACITVMRLLLFTEMSFAGSESCQQLPGDELHPENWTELVVDLDGTPTDDAAGGQACMINEQEGSYLATGAGPDWRTRAEIGKFLPPAVYRVCARIKGSGVFRLSLADMYIKDKASPPEEKWDPYEGKISFAIYDSVNNYNNVLNIYGRKLAF